MCIFASASASLRDVFDRTVDLAALFRAGGAHVKSLDRTPALSQWYKANYWILYGKQGTDWPRSGKGRGSGREFCAGAYLREQRLCYQPLVSASRSAAVTAAGYHLPRCRSRRWCAASLSRAGATVDDATRLTRETVSRCVGCARAPDHLLFAVRCDVGDVRERCWFGKCPTGFRGRVRAFSF